MSPLPRVPAGRFRRSGTRDLAEAAERLFCGLWSRGILGVDPMPDECICNHRTDATPGSAQAAARAGASGSRCQRKSVPSSHIRCMTRPAAVPPRSGAHLAPALEHLEAPALDPAPAAHPGQQHVRGLTQQSAHGFVAALGDVTGVVSLARGILLGVSPK